MLFPLLPMLAVPEWLKLCLTWKLVLGLHLAGLSIIPAILGALSLPFLLVMLLLWLENAR